jgi:hypothetical protein
MDSLTVDCVATSTRVLVGLTYLRTFTNRSPCVLRAALYKQSDGGDQCILVHHLPRSNSLQRRQLATFSGASEAALFDPLLRAALQCLLSSSVSLL